MITQDNTSCDWW